MSLRCALIRCKRGIEAELFIVPRKMETQSFESFVTFDAPEGFFAFKDSSCDPAADH